MRMSNIPKSLINIVSDPALPAPGLQPRGGEKRKRGMWVLNKKELRLQSKAEVNLGSLGIQEESEMCS